MKVKSFQEFWIKMLSTSVLDQSHQRISSEWPEWICFKPWCQTCLLGLCDVFRRFVAWWKNARKPPRSSYIVNSFYLWARKEASCGSSGPTSWPGGRESWAQSQHFFFYKKLPLFIKNCPLLFIKNSMLQIVIYKKLNFWEEYTPLLHGASICV